MLLVIGSGFLFFSVKFSSLFLFARLLHPSAAIQQVSSSGFKSPAVSADYMDTFNLASFTHKI